MQQPLTPFERHCAKWADGCGARECNGARKVFARGKIPCGILLVGEAPGESEDLLGFPFKGPAGILQDGLLNLVNVMTVGLLEKSRVGFCNLVCCIPREEGESQKAANPHPEQINSCRPRLDEFIAIAAPRLIVSVGKLAEEYLDYQIKGVKEIVRVVHPAAILRAKAAQQSMMRQRYIAVITEAVQRHFGDTES